MKLIMKKGQYFSENFTHSGIEILLKNFSQLKSLKLKTSIQYENIIIHKIIQYGTSIESLVINNYKNFISFFFIKNNMNF